MYVQLDFIFNLGSIDGLIDAALAGPAAETCDYSEGQIAQLHGRVHQLRPHGLLNRSPEQRLHHATLALQSLAPEARFARSQAELFYGMALHQTSETEDALAFLSDGLRQQLARPDARATRLVIGILSISTMASASLALQAFQLAFVTSLAVNRFDIGRGLIVDEANAIGTTYLRHPEPDSVTRSMKGKVPGG